jgi:hypothetical protein
VSKQIPLFDTSLSPIVTEPDVDWFALSLREPWLWAVLNAHKRIENRVAWLPHHPSVHQARKRVGTQILLHAAKGCTRKEFDEAIDFMANIGALRVGEAQSADYSKPIPPRLDALTRGAIVGRARLDGLITSAEDMAAYAANVPDGEAQRAWWMGAFALVLADVERLVEPIPFSGSLGFFAVPAETMAGARWEPAP